MMKGTTRTLLGLLVLPGLVVALSCATGPVPQADDPAPTVGAGVAAAPAATQDRHPRVDYSTSCQDCHRASDPAIVRDWEQSLHGQQGVGCFVCHGDGTFQFEARPGDGSCVACHSVVMGSLAHPPADRCFSCHDAHRLAYP
jgi:hypothetical protein